MEDCCLRNEYYMKYYKTDYPRAKMRNGCHFKLAI